MLMCIISFYVIGCVLALLVYDVILYEKYNKHLFKEKSKKDIISISFILFSWFYFLTCLFKFKKMILKL